MKKGWQTKLLGEICNVVGGGTPPKDKPEFYSGNIPWATVRDMKQDVITETEFKITKDAVKSSSTNVISSGNVVIATRVGLGKVCLLGQDTAINQDLRGIIPLNSQTLNVRYLYWWFKTISDAIIAEGTGATVQGVKLPFIKSLQIPVPPLAEQKRIVAKLDEAFAGLAKAKENAEKNLQNARALFESYLESVFAQQGKGWVEKRLDEACAIIMGQSPDGKTYNTAGEGVPLVNGPVEFSPDPFGKTVCSKFTTKPTKMCKKDDLILCVRGSTTGRMNISGFDACVGRGVAAIRAREYQPWINHFINAKREEIYRLGTGATFPNVSGAILCGLKISIPALPTQKEIVKRLDNLREETQLLASHYQKKAEAFESLKKSILHEAFSGNL